MKFTSALFLSAALILVSCASSEKVTRTDSRRTTSPPRVRGFDKMVEDFDPLTLDDDDIVVEDLGQSSTGYEGMPTTPAEAQEDSVVTGYRVQLIQTTDPEEAREAEQDAILRFEEEVYRVFDPPFYKVRVGDFLNWRDAEELQKLAVRKGFREAWVVRTKVNLRNVYKEFERYNVGK
ncbi:MAG: SPOR domain-containing protein [Calditrichaeota bacterium]|nr:MAG: SPOR domain-containing protein [Calditrichota bacterium]